MTQTEAQLEDTREFLREEVSTKLSSGLFKDLDLDIIYKIIDTLTLYELAQFNESVSNLILNCNIMNIIKEK